MGLVGLGRAMGRDGACLAVEKIDQGHVESRKTSLVQSSKLLPLLYYFDLLYDNAYGALRVIQEICRKAV